MVLVTEFRKPILKGEVKSHAYGTINNIFTERGYHIIEMNGEADHINILFEAEPDMTPAELVNVIKTKTARFVRSDLPDEVSKIYPKPMFWSDSYFVTTVGANSLDIVQDYIQKR